MSKRGDWKIPNRIEREYARALKSMSIQIEARIRDINNPYEIVRKLKRFSHHPQFHGYCEALAKQMTTNVQKQVNGTWRKSAQMASRGSSIHRAIMAELRNGGIGDAFYNKVFENAAYIKSFPQDIALELTDYIQSETLKGRRASDIAKDLAEKYKGSSQAQINLIARTEVSKTQTALTQARAEKLGLSWYIWRTSDDARVRNSHRHMEGVLINWNNPPSPEALAPNAEEKPYGNYHAGDTFNDRCYPEPVISLDFLTFPVKVYYNGKIQHMRRVEFEKIA